MRLHNKIILYTNVSGNQTKTIALLDWFLVLVWNLRETHSYKTPLINLIRIFICNRPIKFERGKIRSFGVNDHAAIESRRERPDDRSNIGRSHCRRHCQRTHPLLRGGYFGHDWYVRLRLLGNSRPDLQRKQYLATRGRSLCR